METYLGANDHSDAEGTALKSTSGWYDEGNGTDDFGFSALPGGRRMFAPAQFRELTYDGYWWTSSLDGGDAWYRSMISYTPDIFRVKWDPRLGNAVRCLRDAE